MSNITKTEITVLEKVEQVSKDLDFQRFKLEDTENLLIIKTGHIHPNVWWFIVESAHQYSPLSATAHFDGPDGDFEKTIQQFIDLSKQVNHEEAEIISEDVTEVQEATEDL